MTCWFHSSTMRTKMSTSSENCVPQLFLLIENSSKANNLGSILRCASAFGVNTIVTIGFSKCAVQGSHGASKNIEIVAFPTGEQAEKYLREEQLCTSIVGLMGPLPDGYDCNRCPVDSDPNTNCLKFTLDGVRSNRCSISLDVATFAKSSICVGLSKDKQGLPLSIGRCCDTLIHVPHLPLCGVTPLLDTPSSLSILLSYLCEYVGFNERDFHEHKFDVTRPAQLARSLNEATDKIGRCKPRRNGQSEQKVYEEEGEEALRYGIWYDICGDY